VNGSVNTGTDGSEPTVRFQAIQLDGQDLVPLFTSRERIPDEPGLSIGEVPFRLVLEVMNPPRLPVIINPGQPFGRVLSTDDLVTLRNRL